MGRLDANMEVLWTAYHQAISQASANTTRWTLATIATLFLVGVVTTRLRGPRVRLANSLLAVAAIATVSMLGTARYDAIRESGYMTSHGRGDSARTVQIVCSVVRLQIRHGYGVSLNGSDETKYVQACGQVPPKPAGIDI